jgi:hypothetical protein
MSRVVEKDRKEIDDIKSRIASSEFTAAVREATVQTIFTAEEAKIGQFGEILANAASAHDWSEISGNLTSFIREIAQLSQADIKALTLLCDSLLRCSRLTQICTTLIRLLRNCGT